MIADIQSQARVRGGSSETRNIGSGGVYAEEVTGPACPFHCGLKLLTEIARLGCHQYFTSKLQPGRHGCIFTPDF